MSPALSSSRFGSTAACRPRRAMLAVSLPSPHFRDLGLLAHVRFLNREHERGRYRECIVSLGDSLHRHNIAGCTPGEALRRAEDMGEVWIDQARPILRQLTLPYTILRHGAVLNSTTFPACRVGLDTLRRRELWFASALEEDIGAFLARDPARCAASSRAYILEELAADIALSRLLPDIDHLYPGSILSTYRALRDHSCEMPLELKGLDRWRFIRTRPSKLLHRLDAAPHRAASSTSTLVE